MGEDNKLELGHMRTEYIGDTDINKLTEKQKEVRDKIQSELDALKVDIMNMSSADILKKLEGYQGKTYKELMSMGAAYIAPLQMRLKELGFLQGSGTSSITKVDGIYGPYTQGEIQKFQGIYNQKILDSNPDATIADGLLDIDGKPGPKTLSALISSDAPHEDYIHSKSQPIETIKFPYTVDYNKSIENRTENRIKKVQGPDSKAIEFGKTITKEMASRITKEITDKTYYINDIFPDKKNDEALLKYFNDFPLGALRIHNDTSDTYPELKNGKWILHYALDDNRIDKDYHKNLTTNLSLIIKDGKLDEIALKQILRKQIESIMKLNEQVTVYTRITKDIMSKKYSLTDLFPNEASNKILREYFGEFTGGLVRFDTSNSFTYPKLENGKWILHYDLKDIYGKSYNINLTANLTPLLNYDSNKKLNILNESALKATLAKQIKYIVSKKQI